MTRGTRPSFGRRLIEWLWSSGALAELRASRRLPSPRTLELSRRAQAAIELGRQALEPPQPFTHGPVDALACELGAEGVYWALRARRSLDEQGSPAAPEAEGPATGDLGTLLAEADPEALSRAAGGREAAQALGPAITGKSFTDYAELPAAEQARLAREVLPFAEGLCDELDTIRAAVERIWVRRGVRLGMLAVLFGALAWGASALGDRTEQWRDLARGKPWVASSKHPDGGCVSPAQECGPNSRSYFFGTQLEENPSIEFDLQAPRTVSGVHVFNRVDCCPDRAVPLVVEASLDHKTWKQVARRNELFTDWKGTFPSVQARWVRFRVPRRTLLHFTGVRILP
jgi:hypothetical protein